MIYHITQKELSLLMIFSNTKTLSGYEEVRISEKRDDIFNSLKTLTEKGYLKKNQEDKYSIDKNLEAWLITASKPHGYMIMESVSDSHRQKNVVYFNRDSIVVIKSNEDGAYELMWLPSLPLAIGHIANEVSNFRNAVTVHIGNYEMSEFEENQDNIIGEEFEPEYIFYMFEEDIMLGSISTYSTSDEQLMLCVKDDTVSVLKPKKSDYINEITRLIAPIHGNAIREGIENVRV